MRYEVDGKEVALIGRYDASSEKGRADLVNQQYEKVNNLLTKIIGWRKKCSNKLATTVQELIISGKMDR